MVKRARLGGKARKRREQIIDAGYSAMLDTGLAIVRTRDVAAAADITVATLHYYFPTKAELVRAVAEYAIAQGIVLPLADLGHPNDGMEWLRGMLTGVRQQAVNEPDRFRLLNEITWASRADPDLRELLASWHGQWHARVVEALEAGRGHGSIRADIDPSAVATGIIYTIFGMVLRAPALAENDAGVVAEFDRLLASVQHD